MPFFSYCQKLKEINCEQHKEFYLKWDNDVFFKTDYYYTQGAQLFWVDPKLRRNPANYFLVRLKDSDLYFGIGIIQEIFTPKDITDTLLNTIDRPYAGTLYLKSIATSLNPEKRIKLTSEFDLGFLGPLSGARQAQEKIHEWLGSTPPQGWDFQVNNRIYVNYNLEIEKELVQISEKFNLNGVSKLRIGTIHDDLHLGANFRIGRVNDYFKGLNLDNKKYTENKDLQIYLQGGLSVSGILYDATLMGGIKPPENNKEYQFRQIKHLVADFNLGFTAVYKMVSLRGSATMGSSKFENAEKHVWGTISLFLRL